MLFSLIYVSTAVHIMSRDELLDILKISKINNAARSVTGILLYKGGNFMQVLEGEEDDVRYIFEKIRKDFRHRDIIILLEEVVQERQFFDWKMAFVNLNEESIKQEPAYSRFLQTDFRNESFSQTKNLANILLVTFKDRLG